MSPEITPVLAPRRPKVAIAIGEPLLTAIFPPDLIARLSTIADVQEVAFADSATGPASYSLSETEILVTGWNTPVVDAKVLASMPSLGTILHAAGSVKHHVAPTAWERGVRVASAAGANALPVAEYTIAAILFGGKRVFQRAHDYADGDFSSHSVTDPDIGNFRRTVGVVGASRVGRLVLSLLHGLDFRLLVHDPTLSDTEVSSMIEGARIKPVNLETLMRESDVVTLHAPELPETYRLINNRMLAAMKDGALLINTSRGSLVDTDALVRHCATGRIDAVLDVTVPEPLPPEHPLFALPNVLVTPHVAGSLGTELQRFGEVVIRQVARIAAGLPLEDEIAQSDLSRIA